MTDKALIYVRCRHALGDIGPCSFSTTASIASVKERLLTEWPKGLGLFPPFCPHNRAQPLL